jgi:hypothetical protein
MMEGVSMMEGVHPANAIAKICSRNVFSKTSRKHLNQEIPYLKNILRFHVFKLI